MSDDRFLIGGRWEFVMILLKVVDVKSCMGKLLLQTVFDNFLVSELEVNTSNRFRISGTLNESYYSLEELDILEGRKYSTWAELRPFVYQVIKGTKTPLSFKIVFILSKHNTESVLKKNGLPFRYEDIGGLFLNMRYDSNGLYFTTGTSLNVFTLDKTMDLVWEKDVKTFLKYHEIACEEVT